MVVVQANFYNQKLRHAVVAQLTTNLADKDDEACFLIKAESAEGQEAGVRSDWLIGSAGWTKKRCEQRMIVSERC